MLTSLEDFDPRTTQYRGNVVSLLPAHLAQVRGEGFCVPLLFDDDTCVPCSATSESLPHADSKKVDFAVSEYAARKIEMETKGQRSNPKWFEMRRFRLTTCQVRWLREDTSLVLQILGLVVH